MTTAEMITRDIQTLRESIAIDWQDLQRSTTIEERAGIRQHIKACLEDMAELYARLEGTNA